MNRKQCIEVCQRNRCAKTALFAASQRPMVRWSFLVAKTFSSVCVSLSNRRENECDQICFSFFRIQALLVQFERTMWWFSQSVGRRVFWILNFSTISNLNLFPMVLVFFYFAPFNQFAQIKCYFKFCRSLETSIFLTFHFVLLELNFVWI